MSLKWKYLPGVSTDYNYSVNSDAVYISSDFGDDIQGDGTSERPFASLSTSKNSIAQGVFIDEAPPFLGRTFADGYMEIHIKNGNPLPARHFHGVHVRQDTGSSNPSWFGHCVIYLNDISYFNANNFYHTLCFKEGYDYLGHTIHTCRNSTFVGGVHSLRDVLESIIASEKTVFQNGYFTNCLISNQNNPVFKFPGESDFSQANGGTDEEKLDNLRERAAVAFGGNSEDHFIDCIYGDPQFQNQSIGDFTLKPGSIAASLAQNGSYVGCYKETIAFHPAADANNSDWYHIDGEKTKNIAVGSEMQVVDSQIDGYVNSKPKSVGSVRELGRIIAKLENDVINGGYIKAVQHFDPSTSFNSSSNLTVGKAYFVASGSANINGTTYVENDRFTAQSSSFTGDAVLHPANDNMMRQAIIVRFSRGDDQFFAGTQLKPNTYYFVEGNSVTYAGGSKQPGSFFHTNSTVLNFTGQGYVREAFEVDYENAPTTGFIFDREKKLMLNYNGNSVLNEIESSNAKLDYDFGRGLNIFARFIQICLVYKAQGNIPYPNE